METELRPTGASGANIQASGEPSLDSYRNTRRVVSELRGRRTNSTQTTEKLMKEQDLHVHRAESMSSMADIGREEETVSDTETSAVIHSFIVRTFRDGHGRAR